MPDRLAVRINDCHAPPCRRMQPSGANKVPGHVRVERPKCCHLARCVGEPEHCRQRNGHVDQRGQTARRPTGRPRGDAEAIRGSRGHPGGGPPGSPRKTVRCRAVRWRFTRRGGPLARRPLPGDCPPGRPLPAGGPPAGPSAPPGGRPPGRPPAAGPPAGGPTRSRAVRRGIAPGLPMGGSPTGGSPAGGLLRLGRAARWGAADVRPGRFTRWRAARGMFTRWRVIRWCRLLGLVVGLPRHAVPPEQEVEVGAGA